MSYYKHHIFFCLNQRSNGEACCADHAAQAGFDHCKSQVKAEKLAGPGGREKTVTGTLIAGSAAVTPSPGQTRME